MANFLKRTIVKLIKIGSVLSGKNTDVSLMIYNFSGSNTHALYRYYLKNRQRFENLKIFPVFQFELLNSSVSKKILFLSRIFHSKVLVGTHYQYLYYKGFKTIYVETEHGFPVKSVGLLDKSVSSFEMKKISRSRRKIDFFLTTSPFYTVGFNSALGFHWSKFVETGCPKNDFLIECKKGVKQVLNIPDDKAMVVYLPTFRKTKETLGLKSSGRFFSYIVNIENFNLKDFLSFLKLNSIYWITKSHPLSLDEISRQKIIEENLRFISDEELIRCDKDLYELLACADLLVTDYSSVWVDFLLTNKPILFILSDIDYYRKERGLTLEPYEQWIPGPAVYTQEELQRELIRLLEDSSYYAEKRLWMKNLMHKYQDANSSKRVWDFIINELLHK